MSRGTSLSDEVELSSVLGDTKSLSVQSGFGGSYSEPKGNSSEEYTTKQYRTSVFQPWCRCACRISCIIWVLNCPSVIVASSYEEYGMVRASAGVLLL